MNRQTPLRAAIDRVSFCDDFFAAHEVVSQYTDDDYREYVIPPELDKLLTDRPYYWMWVERMGEQVPPTILRLAFRQQALERETKRLREETLRKAEEQQVSTVERMYVRPPSVELCTLGSFRLHRICDILESEGQFAAVQARSPSTDLESGGNQTADHGLVPWLLATITVTYRCDQLTQDHLSLGICMTNGQIVDNFMDTIRQAAFVPANVGPLLQRSAMSPKGALDHLRSHALSTVCHRPSDWAQEACSRLQAELRHLQTYYNSILCDVDDEQKTEIEREHETRARLLSESMSPRVELRTRQLALVGLRIK